MTVTRPRPGTGSVGKPKAVVQLARRTERGRTFGAHASLQVYVQAYHVLTMFLTMSCGWLWELNYEHELECPRPAQQHNSTAVCCSSIGCPTSCPNYDSHEMQCKSLYSNLDQPGGLASARPDQMPNVHSFLLLCKVRMLRRLHTLFQGFASPRRDWASALCIEIEIEIDLDIHAGMAVGMSKISKWSTLYTVCTCISPIFTYFHHVTMIPSDPHAKRRIAAVAISQASWAGESDEWLPHLFYHSAIFLLSKSHLTWSRNFGAGTHAISILIPEHSCNLMQLRRRKPESGKYRLSQIFSTEWKGLDVHLMSTQKQISPTVQVRSWNAELQWSLLTFFSAHANCWFDSCNFLINRMQYSKSSLSTKGWRRGKLCFFTMQVPETH